MISPINTYVGLTHVGPATAADEPERYRPTGSRNYVRLVGRRRRPERGDRPVPRKERAPARRPARRRRGNGVRRPGGSRARRTPARAHRRRQRRLGCRVNRLPVAGTADRSGRRGCGCRLGVHLLQRAPTGGRPSPRPRQLRDPDRDPNFTEGFLRRAGAVFDGMYITSAGRPPKALPLEGLHFLAQLFPGRSAAPGRPGRRPCRTGHGDPARGDREIERQPRVGH